jgi:hypothetical protein
MLKRAMAACRRRGRYAASDPVYTYIYLLAVNRSCSFDSLEEHSFYLRTSQVLLRSSQQSHTCGEAKICTYIGVLP